MNNHPTIDIISAPDDVCPNPVYNCIEYCFAANAYIVNPGAAAILSVLFQGGTVAAGTIVTIFGYEFQTGLETTENTFVWSGTAEDTAASLETMLLANYEFSQSHTVATLFSGGQPYVAIVSNDAGEIEDFVNDFGGQPVIFFEQNGEAPEYIGGGGENGGTYRLVIEVWECVDGVKTNFITKKGYIPDPDTGEVCVDISTMIQPYAETIFLDPFTEADYPNIFNAGTKKEICLYFGEVYADEDTVCESEPRFFEITSPIEIFNGAFDRNDDEKFSPFCVLEAGVGVRFLTNRPDYMSTCLDSVSWLYFCAPPEILEIGASVFMLHTYTYSDGSTSTGGSLPVTQQTELGIIAFPSGGSQTFLQPGRTLVSYAASLHVFFPQPIGLFEVTQPVIFKVDENLCCCYEEFYFLTKPGGVDTILFNCDREVDLQISSSEFCGYEPCEGSILEGGKREAEINGYEIYRTTSAPVPTYAINWYREFFMSSDRRVRKDGKVYRIVLLTKQIPMFRREGRIYYTFEYILSFDINTQQN